MMSKSLPYSVKDLSYDNAKFRHRSNFKVAGQYLINSIKHDRPRCSTGMFLFLSMLLGLTYLMMIQRNAHNRVPNEHDRTNHNGSTEHVSRFLKIRKPPKFEEVKEREMVSKWADRQHKVKEAFLHAWSGYEKYAMGHDELMPLSHQGVDGLGGLGATVVDALDTAMIMGLDQVVSEANSWVETHLLDRIKNQGQVNLFETTIRVLGGLLSAYHLHGEMKEVNESAKEHYAAVYLETAKNLADRLLLAFTSSPTAIPFSDVVLRDPSAHRAPDGTSSTSEVSTLQLEFNYLSKVSGDPTYGLEAMKVFEHLKTIPKMEGLVPIYISPDSGEFIGENIRLGSRGDSYYEYLIKVWIQRRNKDNNFTFLYDMFEEAMKGVRHLLVKKSRPSGLVFAGELPHGVNGAFSPKMDHLVCFLPGALALGATKGVTRDIALRENLLSFDDLENLKLAEDLAHTCFQMYATTSTGLAPEIAYFHTEDYFEDGLDGGNKSSAFVKDIVVKRADRHNLLRPETVESFFILYRITEDPKYREWGWQIFEAFEKHSKVETGGYSSLDDVTLIPPPKRDKMETFFLGETLKYLYLLFGDKSVLPLDKFVFNTEAHPFPI